MKCCDLNAGTLRHSVTIERPVKTATAAGGGTIDWQEVATIRCRVKPMSGGERLASQRLESAITHRIYTRYRTDLLPSDRVNFGGRLMQIKAIINMEEANRWFEIYAEEGVPT